MKVLVRDSMFCVENPKANKEIDNLGALDGVGHDEYLRFNIEFSEGRQPELSKYLRSVGIGDDEMILVEFD